VYIIYGFLLLFSNESIYEQNIVEELLMAEDIFPLVGAGLLAIAVITAPIWLAALMGEEPDYCECGAKIEPSGIVPSCRCYY